MAMSSAGLGPQSDCSGNDQKHCASKLQIHPLVRESAPHKETRNRQTENINLIIRVLRTQSEEWEVRCESRQPLRTLARKQRSRHQATTGEAQHSCCELLRL
jgi:hypothetical protein